MGVCEEISCKQWVGILGDIAHNRLAVLRNGELIDR